MNKSVQTLLIIGLGSAAIYLLWKNLAPANTLPVTPPPAPPAPVNPCASNLSPCANGNGCYDPKINYLIDPCAPKKKLEQVIISN